MNNNNQKKILLLLIIVALIVWVDGSKLFSKKKPDNKSDTSIQSVLDLKKMLSLDVNYSLSKMQKSSRFADWGRDPFYIEAAPEAEVHKLPILGGILWSDENPTAIIGDAVVKAGDVIDIYKIIEIKQDSVLITDGTQNYELK